MINIHEQIFLTTFSSGTFNSALYLVLLLTVLPTCYVTGCLVYLMLTLTCVFFANFTLKK